MTFFTPQVSARFVYQYGRAFFCATRHYGSSPEMPIVGSKEWQSMLNNLRTQKVQPPISRAEILNSQRLRRIEFDIKEIKEMMAKVVESNKHMQESFEKLQHKSFVPQQPVNN